MYNVFGEVRIPSRDFKKKTQIGIRTPPKTLSIPQASQGKSFFFIPKFPFFFQPSLVVPALTSNNHRRRRIMSVKLLET